MTVWVCKYARKWTPISLTANLTYAKLIPLVLGSSAEPLDHDGRFDLNDDLRDPFGGLTSPTTKLSASLSASTASSSGHSTKSSSSRKYVKLTTESFRLRR
ncbi:unnamed protein product [Aspergillus oryzae]|uniref:Unnamed protein product n=2 Tax=Aspergillus oryzae TaxID=5062 RepID=A0AAN4Z1K7_ASPOZ|nr:unnamed protein product [Aspergillus oryzae]GMF92456.1 unnamed protein product [Aspergillus oryzae]GMG03285.1 unnamed protein product [Aspergillus oryzae]GMG38292.1 unnamed protein product [Aspergillus oryzae]GMG46177.1 unnamed protein product [Aspergillus oryzae var. brunneus]